MTGVAIFRLVLQLLVFLVWAFLMYRTLFLFRAREVEETGRPFPGVGGFLRQAGRWWRSPEDRRDRNTLLFITFVLLAMVAMQALGAAGGEPLE